MGYLDGGFDIPGPKVNKKPLDITEDPNKNVQAEDWNPIRTALGEVRYRLGEATTDLHIYVDFIAGNDANAGTSPAPLLTLEEVVRRLAIVWGKYQFNVHLKAATPVVVTGNWEITKLINAGKNDNVNLPWCKFLNDDFSLITGLVGPNTGTFTSTSGTVQTMASATWATDELRGWLLEIVDGTLSGKRYAIKSNTATGVKVGHVDANFNGASFRIVKPNVDFQPLDATKPVFTIAGGMGFANCLQFYGMSVTGGVRGFRTYNSASFVSCLVKDQTIYSIEARHADVVYASYSYLQSNSGTNAAVAFNGSYSKRIVAAGCVFRGPGNTGTSRAFEVRPSNLVSLGSTVDPCFVENVTSGVIIEGGEVFATVVTDSTVPSSGVFIYNATALLDSCDITGSSNGLVAGTTSLVTDPCGSTSLRIINSIISGTSYGIGMGATGSGSSIQLAGTTTVTGTAGPGVLMDCSNGYLEIAETAIVAGTGAAGVKMVGLNNSVIIKGGSGGGCAIQNSTIGIQAAGDGSRITCNTAGLAAAIKNNSVSGVELQGVGCSFKSSTDLTMTGNAGGSNQDFKKAPGAAYTTLTALRAITGPPAKLDKDINYMNVIWEP
jgi:hypothetical protein